MTGEIRSKSTYTNDGTSYSSSRPKARKKQYVSGNVAKITTRKLPRYQSQKIPSQSSVGERAQIKGAILRKQHEKNSDDITDVIKSVWKSRKNRR